MHCVCLRCFCVCVWIVKGADPSLALLSLDKRTCRGPVSLRDPPVFPVTRAHCCWKQASRQDWWRRQGAVCGGVGLLSVQLSAAAVGCGHWLAVPLLSLSLLSRKWEWARSQAGLLVFLYVIQTLILQMGLGFAWLSLWLLLPWKVLACLRS